MVINGRRKVELGLGTDEDMGGDKGRDEPLEACTYYSAGKKSEEGHLIYRQDNTETKDKLFLYMVS